MKTTQYLDAVKRRLGISSDYALADALELTRFAVSKLRRGHVTMSATTAARVAELLELEPIQVIADAELERGSSPELWKRIRAAAAWTAIAIGAACFGLAPQPAQARFNNNVFAVTFPAGPVRAQCDRNTHCAASRRRRGAIGAAIAAFIAWLAGVAL